MAGPSAKARSQQACYYMVLLVLSRLYTVESFQWLSARLAAGTAPTFRGELFVGVRRWQLGT